MTEAEVEVIQPQTKELWHLLEGEKERNRLSPGLSRKKQPGGNLVLDPENA
jgi:hypothetical protein